MPKDFVQIFDTTLRDGEQSPGATMTQQEKIRIARALDEMSVDVLEAGFPAASQGEVESVQAVSKAVENATVAALCRTRENDIAKAMEALCFAKHKRLHVFIATSDIHLKYKLKMSRAEVLKQIAFGVGACASLVSDVEFSAEDATRTDIGFLKEAMACALEHGARVLNVPDTVGYTTPNEFFKMIEAVVELANPYNAIVSAHCHNDLGLAVANSLAAVQAGARQVEGCINGLGERAGNAAIEEVVMALRTRQGLYHCDTRIETERIFSMSRLVSEITGFTVQPNKAIVGKNAFAHESGIHQHGVLEERETYEIIDPKDVGIPESNIVLGKHSGRHALRDRLSQLGYEVDDLELKRVFLEFKDLADRKKNIYDEDLHVLANRLGYETEQSFNLVNVNFTGSKDAEGTAHLELMTVDGTVVKEATGDGPVHAVFEALKACTGFSDIRLVDYQVSAVSSGSDAQGRAIARIETEYGLVQGHGTHTDVVVASALAFVDAANALCVKVINEELIEKNNRNKTEAKAS
ncbi:MAG: 2-isopropylmalate synthase [Myxococcota bacterium]|nr:2-isopropylmalate synthase [Myxococcota bacterium]